MTNNSRIPAFRQLSLEERRSRVVADTTTPEKPLKLKDAIEIWESGGLDALTSSQIVENVLGTYSLPLGVALNATINGQDRLIPMVVEEPSVIAATSNACKMIRQGGGFFAKVEEALMIAQVELRDVKDPATAESKIRSIASDILAQAARAVPGLIRRGGGPQELKIRQIGPDHFVVHILVDCCDAMGANLVNSVAEATGPLIAEACGARLGLRILSNLSDRRLVVVTVDVPESALGASDLVKVDLPAEIEAASLFAERDPYRAATHNKGIMNGVDSVVIATGNDYRAVEAGAHAYAARSGTYLPLATWKKRGSRLRGAMTVPLALGVVGGTLRVHPGARLSLSVAQIENANDLAIMAACAGLASNLAALRALSLEGIQRGHMALHARSIAIAAGANDDEVNRVAKLISEAKSVDLEAAKQALLALRAVPLE